MLRFLALFFIMSSNTFEGVVEDGIVGVVVLEVDVTRQNYCDVKSFLEFSAFRARLRRTAYHMIVLKAYQELGLVS